MTAAENRAAGERLAQNLVLYQRHQVASRLLFWFPTSILFLLEGVGLRNMLMLNSVYFLAVVIIEVPSGWMSDRLGRVLTLRLGALWWVAAYALFLVSGSSVLLLALAQVLVAMGFAFLSGTDTAFHFDSLEALGREAEFDRREAKVGRNALLGTAAAAIIGGVLGLIDLRLPFAASLVGSMYQAVLAFGMAEPSTVQAGTGSGLVAAAGDAVDGSDARLGDDGPGQLMACLGYLKRPGLAWVFLFLTLQQPLEGLAFDLLQPWLAELTGNSLADAGAAPLYSGLLVAVISFVGAISASQSVRMRLFFGLRLSLGILAGIEAAILAGMALVVSPWLIPLLALRSTQAGAAPIIVATEVAPQIARTHRATFLSLGSLSGRLAYGAVLLALRLAADFSEVLVWSAAVGIASVVALAFGAAVLRDGEQGESARSRFVSGSD